MEFCYYILAGVGFLLLLYFLLEFHYFLRTCLCLITARICKKKVHILDETTIRGICITTDIDSLLTHMNNARFVRELDFAKVDFYDRTGLYQCIKKHGGALAMGATTIRYRRFIKLFSRYMITSKIIYWDSQNIYMEHRFVTPKDNFVNAIVLCKTRLTKCNAEDVMIELLTNSTEKIDVENAKNQKPVMPLELQKWIESNDISSAILRSTSHTCIKDI